jgi:hypothetical protein
MKTFAYRVYFTVDPGTYYVSRHATLGPLCGGRREHNERCD